MINGVDGHPPLDGAAIQAQLDSLLASHPTALIAAIGADGIFVPMPESFALLRYLSSSGTFKAVDFVVAEDGTHRHRGL